MENINKIKDIHASDAYGILIETGCGLAVSNALLEVSGASNTIYLAECPYSKEYQTFKYGETNARAVSMENIKHIMNYYKALDKPDNVNFIYAASFQLGEHNDKSTHGWIGLSLKGDDRRYFHISIHESLTRKQYIDKISKIGIDILNFYIHKSTGTNFIPSNCCIDIALNGKGEQVNLTDMFVSLRYEDDENFLCFKEGKLVRMEDLFRDQKNIALFKGSFNPIHAAHIHTAQLAKDEYGIEPVFVISSSVYQKGWIESEDLKQRVETLNDLGYSVIITKDGYFNKNTAYIRQKFKQPLIYVVGSDTLNRILESSYNILNPIDSKEYNRYLNQLVSMKPDNELITDKELDEIEEMALSHYMRKFKEDFQDVRFFVVNRPGSELKEEVKLIQEYYKMVEEHPEYFHISSTKIRAMLIAGDYESIKKLIPEKIFEKYINQKTDNHVNN